MRTTWRLRTWRGVPILLHWTLLLGLPFFYILRGSLADMATAFLSFFLLLLGHELGHAAMAKWRRVPVLEIRLFILHGYCEHEDPENAADAVWIAWGGVLAQGILLVLTLGARELLLRQDFYAYLVLGPVWYTLIATNLVIIVLNLLPLPRFDGHKAWQGLPLIWAPACPRRRIPVWRSG